MPASSDRNDPDIQIVLILEWGFLLDEDPREPPGDVAETN
jgi:hypothetical protein